MQRLHIEEVNHIFTVTGRGALFLTDALAKFKDIQYVCSHHEQASAYSAVAYAQFNNKIGCCLVSTGCAATNTISGVLSAWQDGISVIFISGQNVLNETSRFTGIPLRTYGQQEADIVSIVNPITKYAVMIDSPDKIVYELEKALYLAQDGRKGPVWIDVPLDIQSMRIEPADLPKFIPPIEYQENINFEGDVSRIQKMLNESKRPVILIGSGIHLSDAGHELKVLVERLNIPVVYAPSAPDAYGTENVMSIGSVGSMGCSRAGNFALQNSDFLLVIGCRLTSLVTGVDFCKFAREAKIAVVDIDIVEHSKKSINIDELVCSDAKKFITQLSTLAVQKVDTWWVDKCLHWKKFFPKVEDSFRAIEKIDLYQLAESLSIALPKKSVLVTDSGLAEVILPSNIVFGPGRRCIHPISQGAMGYALPASVGAHYSSKLPVITVIGDGSIMMNIQELQTISFNNLPIKIFIINNNVYSIIRKRQIDLFRSRTIGTDPSNGVSCPNFKKVAESYEIPYKLIESSENLTTKLKDIIDLSGPVICEVLGREDQNYIETSQTRNQERRLVRRPLEDQAPFLDRDIFLSEMIIDPIDQ